MEHLQNPSTSSALNQNQNQKMDHSQNPSTSNATVRDHKSRMKKRDALEIYRDQKSRMKKTKTVMPWERDVIDIPFRSATAALMKSNPALYNTNNLTPDEYSEYVECVEKYGVPVGLDVELAAVDLIGAGRIPNFAG